MGLLSFSKLFLIIAWFRAQGSDCGGGFAAKKGSQPRLATLGSPFQRKGLAWTLPPSIGRRRPEGAEVGWGWRYEKKRRGASQVRRLRKHPIHRWRGPPSPMGKAAIRGCRYPRNKAFPAWGRQRGGGFAAQKESQPRLAALGSPFQGKGLAWTLPPSYGRRCPEGADKDKMFLKCSAVLCKSIYEFSIIKQMIWTGWGLVTSSGVTPLQNR